MGGSPGGWEALAYLSLSLSLSLSLAAAAAVLPERAAAHAAPSLPPPPLPLLPLLPCLANPPSCQVKYSHFQAGLREMNVQLNRKVLSELAMNEPFSFKALVDQVKHMRGIA